MKYSSDEEHRLLYMLHEFHKGMADDCVLRADECSKCPKVEELRAFRWILSRETRQPIAYRMPLKETTYFVLSHPLSRFMHQEDYYVGGEDAEFCAKLGMVPAYAMNIDRFTLLKLWGEMAKRVFSPTAKPIPESGYAYWRLVSKTGKLPELSSMNFVLKQSGEFLDYQGKYSDLLHRYFTFGFWSLPEKGFSNSTVIINNDEAVRLVLKSSKTLFIPSQPYYLEMDFGREKGIDSKVVTLFGIVKGKSGYQLQTYKDVVLTKDVAISLDAEQRRGTVLINGIVCEFIRRSTWFPTLTAVDLYEISNFELFESIIGLVAHERHRNGSSLSTVGTVEEIRKETERVLQLLLPKAFLDKTIADSFPDQYTLALEYLKPMLVTDEEEVMYLHPSVLIALIENGLDRILDREHDIVNVLKVLDMIPRMTSADIYQSKTSKHFKDEGYFPERIYQALKPVVAQIDLMRFLERPRQESPSATTTQPAVASDNLQPKEKRLTAVRRSGHYTSVDIMDEDQQDVLKQIRELNKKLKEAARDGE
jgi:hypothetical protein